MCIRDSDYAVLAIVAASILVGAWRGLVSEVLALAAWVAALLAGRALAPDLAPVFGDWLKEPAWQYAGAFAVIVVAVLVAVALLRIALSKLLRAIGLGPLDRFLGAVFGVARGGLCLLYTSDAADERSSVDLGGRRLIQKKTKKKKSAAAELI